MDKRLVILICFFSVLTLISSVVCSSLVYLNETARTEVNSKKVLASNNIYNSISVNYNQDNTLNLSSIEPGYSITRTFNIINNNSNTIKYNIEWTDIISTWNTSDDGQTAHPEELVYTLICSNGEKIENEQMPTSNNGNIILENLELKTNKINECSITVKFKNTGTDQSYNYNKSFRGTYKVIVQK